MLKSIARLKESVYDIPIILGLHPRDTAAMDGKMQTINNTCFQLFFFANGTLFYFLVDNLNVFFFRG